MREKSLRSVAQIAREFRVPWSRAYNGLSAVGVSSSTELSPDEVDALVIELQQSSIPFSALVLEYGEDYTLGDLASLEVELVNEKYKKLWEKRGTVQHRESIPVVDFTNNTDDRISS